MGRTELGEVEAHVHVIRVDLGLVAREKTINDVYSLLYTLPRFIILRTECNPIHRIVFRAVFRELIFQYVAREIYLNK